MTSTPPETRRRLVVNTGAYLIEDADDAYAAAYYETYAVYVPLDVYERWCAAEDARDAVIAEICAIGGIDIDEGRLARPCATWKWGPTNSADCASCGWPKTDHDR